jgi:hypothetical protein
VMLPLELNGRMAQDRAQELIEQVGLTHRAGRRRDGAGRLRGRQRCGRGRPRRAPGVRNPAGRPAAETTVRRAWICRTRPGPPRAAVDACAIPSARRAGVRGGWTGGGRWARRAWVSGVSAIVATFTRVKKTRSLKSGITESPFPAPSPAPACGRARRVWRRWF